MEIPTGVIMVVMVQVGENCVMCGRGMKVPINEMPLSGAISRLV